MGQTIDMERAQLASFNLPDVPGVYLFKKGRKVLYVGKATSLRDRVKSYFDDDLIATRGPKIVDMVTKADRIAYETTPTVLEALVREAALIKHYMPPANTDGKDDSSFLYAIVTMEEIPRVIPVRGNDLDQKTKHTREGVVASAIYGPFPSGVQLREGLRLIRRIFPFYDTPKPVGHRSKHQAAKVEFNRQLGQYPRSYDAKEYQRTIRHVKLFLSGRGKELRRTHEREMHAAAKAEAFEEAAELRRELFALDHIQDVSLVKEEHGGSLGRIEAYDTAHLAGTNAVGVMVVLEDGVPAKKEYRSFNIKGVKPRRQKSGSRPLRASGKNDDIGSLREVLSRRLGHPEWPYPTAIVVDGGKPQKKTAETVLAEAGLPIPVVAIVKDERHRPREVIGAHRAGVSEADAVLANAEAHRFSLARHRAARAKPMRA